MRRLLIALILSTMAGCSDWFIERAETGQDPRSETTLAGLSQAARTLSDRYVDAARSTRGVQDATVALTWAAAFSTVTGAVGEASDAALARRALTGAGASRAGTRLAPGSAIRAMYNGARRLNCISTVSGMGAEIDLGGDGPAAVAATIGAIDHVRILTREGLVREVEDFAGVLDSFKAAAASAAQLVDPGRSPVLFSRAAPTAVKLDQYLKILSTCTANNATTVPNEIPKAN